MRGLVVLSIRSYMKKFIQAITGLIYLSIFLFSCNSFKQKPLEATNIPDEFADFIANHTSGTISKSDPIRIDFKRPIDLSLDPNNHLEITNGPTGIWQWKDSLRAVFKHSSPFQGGAFYSIRVDLAGLFEQVPAALAHASFNIGILQPEFEVTHDGLHFMDGQVSTFRTTLTLRTADHITDHEAEKMFRILDEHQDLQIQWNHINSRLHQVSVSKIQRSLDTYPLRFHWVGSVIGMNKQIETKILVPAKGDFRVTRVSLDPESANYVEIYFSDLLNRQQSMDGLIEIEDLDDYTYQVTTNQLLLFFDKRLEGAKQLKVSGAIQNLEQERLGEDFQQVLTFESIPPAVRFVKGSILPSSNGTSTLR